MDLIQDTAATIETSLDAGATDARAESARADAGAQDAPPPDAAAPDLGGDAPTSDGGARDAPRPDGAGSDARLPLVVTGKSWLTTMASADTTLLAIDVDSSGNSYVIGHTWTANYNEDVFVAKLDARGSIVWTATAGDVTRYDDFGRSIAVDKAGYVYIAGTFCEYHPSTNFKTCTGTFGSTTLVTNDYPTTFVAKLSPRGKFIWAKALGGTGGTWYDAPWNLDLDSSGNPHLAGNLYHFTGGSSFTSSSYVARLDPQGKVKWNTHYLKDNDGDSGEIVIDSTGNTYVVGECVGTAPFSFGTITLAKSGLYLAKLNGSGNIIQAKNLSDRPTHFPLSIDLDGSSNIWLAGSIKDKTTFGTTTFTVSGWFDGYVSRLSPGGTPFWTQSVGGSGADTVSDVAVDGSGKGYLAGKYTDPLTLGPFNLVPGPWFDVVFLGVADSTGSYVWAARGMESYYNSSGSYHGELNGMKLDPSGNLYVVGRGTGCVGHYTLKQVGRESLYWVWKVNAAEFRSQSPFVNVKAGSFSMGSPRTELCRENNEDLHTVTLSHDFKIMATEVSRGEFKILMGYNPTKFYRCGSTSYPVDSVSWHEAAAYCNNLSIKHSLKPCYSCSGKGRLVSCGASTGYRGKKIYLCPGYRLPTEAEWEYAYRAGSKTALYSGGISYCGAPDRNAEKIAWYKNTVAAAKHATRMTRPSAGKKSNAWGLYDMAGNVAEWVNDRYVAHLGSSAVTDPWGSPTNSHRPVKGGSFADYPRALRGAFRLKTASGDRSSGIGFRCVQTLKP
jgi:formylglycine-generating enzyme required for sulfatase activity